MKALTLHSLADCDRLASPDDNAALEMDSPAVGLFTDFREHEPQVVDATMRADAARREMLHTHGKMRLVVDHNDVFVGTVSVEQLAEAQLLAHLHKGDSRNEVVVSDLMTRRDRIHAVSYDDLTSATVADVIETLRSNGERHCLVVDTRTNQILGIIAASDIAKRLHMPIEIKTAPTFGEIVSALAH